jgi:glycosyltransferase involved in cell wall biosynthesis
VVQTKNLHSLIDMLAQMPERKLLIVGDDTDPYAAELRKRIVDAGLNDRVQVLGPVSDAERLWLFQHADALLQPSLAEGFGLPVLEAMACGTPVFLARRTSLPEVGGELAFYWDEFEPDAMATVFQRGMTIVAADPTYPDRLVAHAATFSWAAAAKGYLDIYRSLAGVSSPPAGAG